MIKKISSILSNVKWKKLGESLIYSFSFNLIGYTSLVAYRYWVSGVYHFNLFKVYGVGSVTLILIFLFLFVAYLFYDVS